MNVRKLVVLATSLPLLAVTGCGPTHAPVSITVMIPSQADAPPHAEAASVLAEKGATLTFEAAPGSPSDTTLEIQFLKNGTATRVCTEGTTLTGQSPVTCHLTATGDFDIAIFENYQGRRHVPRPQVKAYIRPCKGCSA